MTVHSPVITVAGGLRVAQRGAQVSREERHLEVVEIAGVQIPDSPAQLARTVDGHVWRRLWPLPDRLVVEYVGLATVEVRDHDGAIVFDRALSSGREQHLLLDHVLPLVLARRGGIVFHGAVLSLNDRGAVLAGPSGAGKSTLTAYAGCRGWVVGGDDGAVVDVGPAVTVEPTYPTIRLTPESLELLALVPDEDSDVVGKWRLSAAGAVPFRQHPSALEVVALVEPAPPARNATFEPLHGAAAHAALFGETFHADLGPGQLLRNVFEGLGRILDAVIVGRLTVPRGLAGLASAEEVLREVVTR